MHWIRKPKTHSHEFPTMQYNDARPSGFCGKACPSPLCHRCLERERAFLPNWFSPPPSTDRRARKPTPLIFTVTGKCTSLNRGQRAQLRIIGILCRQKLGSVPDLPWGPIGQRKRLCFATAGRRPQHRAGTCAENLGMVEPLRWNCTLGITYNIHTRHVA